MTPKGNRKQYETKKCNIGFKVYPCGAHYYASRLRFTRKVIPGINSTEENPKYFNNL